MRQSSARIFCLFLSFTKISDIFFQVSYDVGNYPVSTMFSYEIISDGKPHRIEILAFGKNFTLRVDDGISRSIVNEGAKEYLTTSSPLYVAGTPEKVAERALKQWHLRNVTSFNGKD